MAQSTQSRFNPSVMSLWSYDIDQLSESLRLWDIHYEQLQPGAVCGCLQQIQIGSIQIFRSQINRSVRSLGSSPQGTLAFGIPLQVPGRAIWHGYECDHNQILLNTNREVDFTTPDNYELFVITIHRQTLSEIAYQLNRKDIVKELDQKSLVAGIPQQLDQLRSYLQNVFQQVQDNPLCVYDAQVSLVTTQTIVRLLLNSIQLSQDAPSSSLRPLRRTSLARRVEEYMLDHMQQALTLGQICEAMEISERSLHYAFQDLFDMSPMAYLKARRLNQVRRYLKLADPRTEKVVDIARQWGFHHMGHFSVDYKAMFGESPSETLKRL
ncbi:MAG: helix-turn-helix domain-containing protein [Leptolyngbya sp. SIO4C5]|uniref:helix-turn-helix domain-containing protein n=1 Tax=Sphaerothrix gracilis TaxID=3151835 RepID=UPI0013C11A49|nr:helix-turn-helix domain-containing protein [Leptolyngbya sp. SIO4C5]